MDAHLSWAHEMARIDAMKVIVPNQDDLTRVRQACFHARRRLSMIEPRPADTRQQLEAYKAQETAALQLVRGAVMLARRQLDGVQAELNTQ